MEAEMPERIMGSPDEAAAILGVGAQTVRRSIKDGTFPVPAKRIGRRIVINLHQLRQWCDTTEAVAS
jgi:excisionase family DNA binding protein